MSEEFEFTYDDYLAACLILKDDDEYLRVSRSIMFDGEVFISKDSPVLEYMLENILPFKTSLCNKYEVQ